MKIEFRTRKRKHDPYDEHGERHIVFVNGQQMMSQSENIEPEDCRFFRDLSSPFDCQNILEMVITAVKNGEEIEFDYTEEMY